MSQTPKRSVSPVSSSPDAKRARRDMEFTRGVWLRKVHEDVVAVKATVAQLVKDNSAEDLAWTLMTFATAFGLLDPDIVEEQLNDYVFPKVPRDVFEKFHKILDPITDQRRVIHPATVLASKKEEIVLQDQEEVFSLHL